LVRAIRVVYDAPTLILPDNGAIGVARKPTFTWATIPGATSYTLHVSPSNTFNVMVINKIINAPITTYLHIQYLLPNTVYYWRVSAKGTYGTSAWSATFTFTTTP